MNIKSRQMSDNFYQAIDMNPSNQLFAESVRFFVSTTYISKQC